MNGILASPRLRPALGPALLVLITLIGFALRLYRLLDYELTFDEGATWYFAGEKLADLWGGPARLETNPPLFYTLAHGLRALGANGEDERLISLLFGTACVPLTYLLAERFAGRFAGFAAALLVALSAAQIGMSQDARAYAALTVAALVALLGVQRLLAGGGAGAAATYAAGALAALYLHDTAVLLVAACNLMVLLAWPRGDWRPFAVRWIAANAVVFLLYAPWIPVVLDQSLHALAHFWLAQPTLRSFRYELLNTYALRFLTLGEPFADLFFVVLLAVGVWATRRTPYARALAIAVVVGVPVASFLISQWRPIMNGKTFLWLVPLGLSFVAAGCAALGRARLPALVLAAALETVATFQSIEVNGDSGWSGMATLLDTEAHDGDAIVLVQPFNAFILDYYGLPANALPTFSLGRRGPWIPAALAPTLAPGQIGATLGGFARLWFVTAQATSAEDRAVLADLRARLGCAFTTSQIAPPDTALAATLFERRPAPACR